ncbi:hypothetical protein MLD38_006418 [Melastoma candidum]|uniref:Uncharacterized protein n=1 Tax=Melastoma candidum TaxID=119954 RepID=A0ACB9RMV5_9MYRT|nr:hypothetical protein MLD38_006418 [Melastoma candidum]
MFAASSAGCGLTRDTASSRARKAEICGRVGSGNQHSVSRGPRKCRPSSPALSRIGEDNTGSSSRSRLPTQNRSDSLVKPRKILYSRLTSGSSGTSCVPDEPEIPIDVPPAGEIRRGRHAGRRGDEVSEVALDVVGDSSRAHSPRNNTTEMDGSPLNSTLTSSGPTKARIPSQAKRAYESRDNLTNSRLNLATNSRSPNEFSSNLNFDRRKGLSKKTATSGEGGTSNRDKKVKQPSDGRTARGFGQGVEISESRRRRARCATIDSNPAVSSVRTRRQNAYDEPRHSVQSNSSESQVMSLRTMRCSEVLDEMVLSLRRSIEATTGRLGTHSHAGSSSEGSRSALLSDVSEMNFPGDLRNNNGFPQYHIEGIVEVLLALDRIEQDDDLTYEPVIATNLFLNGMNLYDQHRDMRLDIDDMSYEELLALEERMGTVSTALTEEELVKSLRIDLYHHPPLSGGTSHHCGQKDDLKCSICQEEYVSGDEVGRLPCEHQYHIACAQQWLRIKNWCPVCKGSAVASSSSSPSRLR